ncbi:MAG: polysaccharide deacetylase family protein [Solirubrobacteraceae bacterium]
MLPIVAVVSLVAFLSIGTGRSQGRRPAVNRTGPAVGLPGTGPVAIAAASLTQDGQQLRWQVTLEHPFSATGLERAGRSLCLVLERLRSRAQTGELCVVPRRGRMALIYTPQLRRGQGRSRAIEATVSRSSREELAALFLPSAIGASYTRLRWEVLSEEQPAVCGTTSSSSSAATTTTSTTTSSTGCPPLVAEISGVAKLHTPVLVGCVPAGPSRVSQGSSLLHEIALTFDDGPSPLPPAIDFVNLLSHYHVPATFFEIGEQIPEFDANGAAERAMLADGDMIGDHTWTHPDMLDLGPAEQTSELELTAAAIRRATGFTPCLFRPPYGDTDPELESLARSLGFLTIMWDVDPTDWALPGVGAIEDRVIGNAHNGAIVIQHFGGGPRYETLSALPDEIQTLRARGYQFVTVTQLLGLQLVYK